MMKLKKRLGKKCIAGVLILGMLTTTGNYSFAKTNKSDKTKVDVKAQYRKDAGEFDKSEDGETKYVVYQKKSGGRQKDKG